MTKSEKDEELREKMTMVHTPDGINHNKDRKKPSKREIMEMTDDQKAGLVIDELWNHMKHNRLNLEYATVGFCGEREVLDFDLFVNLLVGYGYGIDYVLAFVDMIDECSQETGVGPLIMKSKESLVINNEIKPFQNSIMRKIERTERKG